MAVMGKRKTAVSLREPSDVNARVWVVGLDAPAIHAAVCESLRWRMITQVQQVSLLGTTTTFEEDTISLKPMMTEAINRVTSASPEGRLELSRAMELISRLTITPLISISIDRKIIHPTAYLDYAEFVANGANAIATWLRRWVTWCTDVSPNTTDVLDEYEFLHSKLAELAQQGPLTTTLRALIGETSRLTFDGWSVNMPRAWRSRARWVRSPSQWTEALISIKHGTHTREIKERLAIDRKERNVQSVWATYGAWLRDRPDAINKLGTLIGVTIVAPARNEPLSR
jgi:hypothetical protein